MAARESEWAYSNDGRIAFVFLALAIVLLAIGLLAVTAFGSDAANGGVALLAIAMFLLVFAVLVFVPRLARRGPASFSVYSRRSLDEAVRAVREAIEASGRTPRVGIAGRCRGSGSAKESHGAPRRRVAARRMRGPTSPCRASRPCHPFRPSHHGRVRRRLPAAEAVTSSRR